MNRRNFITLSTGALALTQAPKLLAQGGSLPLSEALAQNTIAALAAVLDNYHGGTLRDPEIATAIFALETIFGHFEEIGLNRELDGYIAGQRLAIESYIPTPEDVSRIVNDLRARGADISPAEIIQVLSNSPADRADVLDPLGVQGIKGAENVVVRTYRGALKVSIAGLPRPDEPDRAQMYFRETYRQDTSGLQAIAGTLAVTGTMWAAGGQLPAAPPMRPQRRWRRRLAYAQTARRHSCLSCCVRVAWTRIIS